MSQLGSDLLDMACRIEQLEAERDALASQVEAFVMKLPGLVRGAYRRGYLAGRASKRRGDSAVTNPEASARGWVREVCR